MMKARMKRWLAWSLIGFGVLAIVTATFIARTSPANTELPPASPAAGVRLPSAQKPKPEDIRRYTVAPNEPKFIDVPAIGVKQARVIGLGLANNGQIAVPDNLYDAGWYSASAKPGQVGAMFIYGHVSSWQAEGLFYDLKKLRVRDTVTVTNGNDQQFTYRVVAIKTYPRDSVDMKSVLASIDSKPGLNLMTCAGKIIQGTNDFSERLVVYTSLET